MAAAPAPATGRGGPPPRDGRAGVGGVAAADGGPARPARWSEALAAARKKEKENAKQPQIFL